MTHTELKDIFKELLNRTNYAGNTSNMIDSMIKEVQILLVMKILKYEKSDIIDLTKSDSTLDYSAILDRINKHFSNEELRQFYKDAVKTVTESYMLSTKIPLTP